jgi:DNA-directed RNA polymerase alpha subunit
MQIELPNSKISSKLSENDILNKPVDQLNLSLRACNVLASKQLRTIRDVIDFGLEKIISIQNAGIKTVKEISDVIEPLIPEKTTATNYLIRNLKEDQINMIKLKILITPIDELNFSVKARNLLASKQLRTIRDVIDFGLEKIISMPNADIKTVKEISDVIEPLIPEKTTATNYLIRNLKEEQIKYDFKQKNLITPIDELNLSTRAFNALNLVGLKTVEDILNFGLDNLAKMKNVGRTTIKDIKKEILSLPEKATQELKEDSFVAAIEAIISCFTPKYLPVLKARYGYEDAKRKTLEEIGDKIGLTRERIRQIIVKELKSIKHKKAKTLQIIIENLERLFYHYNGIISINDMAKDEYFCFGTRKQIIFLNNLIADLYEERYRIIHKYFFTNLDTNEIVELQAAIQETALKCRFPIEEKVFIENILLSICSISEDYLAYYLWNTKCIEMSQGKILSLGKLSIPQRIEFIMKDIERPIHYTEITNLYKECYGYKKEYSNIEHAIHSALGRSKVVIIAPGIYILRNKFKIPKNIKEIAETAKEILRSVGDISDTRYLIKELKKRNVDIGNLNEYSLKSILLEYPNFVSYRKFEIGIKEHTDKTRRKSLVDLIYAVLVSSQAPLHAKEVWKHISKQRGFPKYAIEQRLQNEQKFIKVASATYTIKKNIPSFEEKSKKIIGFAQEWIQLKKKSISAFLISEVLKETDKIKDFPIGLVEHVLSTSTKFIKLRKGFYKLKRGY